VPLFFIRQRSNERYIRAHYQKFKDPGKMNSFFAISVSILKTVEEVSLCVIMMYLGLNDLITEMFECCFSVVFQNPFSEDVHYPIRKIMSEKLG